MAPKSSLADGTGRLDYFADFGIGPDRLQEDDLASFQRLDPQAVRSQVQLTLPSSGTRIVYLYLLFWQPDARAAADYADLPALYQGMRQRLPDLEAATAAFGGDLPTSGDPGI